MASPVQRSRTEKHVLAPDCSPAVLTESEENEMSAISSMSDRDLMPPPVQNTEMPHPTQNTENISLSNARPASEASTAQSASQIVNRPPSNSSIIVAPQSATYSRSGTLTETDSSQTLGLGEVMSNHLETFMSANMQRMQASMAKALQPSKKKPNDPVSK